MLAKAAGVSLRSVQRILEAHQLAPHRIRTFKLSNDPQFAEKLKDIVGLYVATFIAQKASVCRPFDKVKAILPGIGLRYWTVVWRKCH